MLSFQTEASAQQTATAYDTTFSEAKWDVLMNAVDYKDYRYNELNIEGYLADDQVVNQISYEDSLLDLRANARLDMKQPGLAYALDLQLNNVNLFRLNLVNDSIILQDFQLLADLQGTDPDSIIGEVRIPSATIIKDAERFQLDSLVLTADRTVTERQIRLQSDYVEAFIHGKFSVGALPQAFEDFQQYYFTSYEAPYVNQDTVKTFEAGGQKLELELRIKETPLLAKVFAPSLNIPDTLSLDAAFNSIEKSMRVDLKAPTLIMVLIQSIASRFTPLLPNGRLTLIFYPAMLKRVV